MKQREPTPAERRRMIWPKHHRPVPTNVAIGTAVLYRSHPEASPTTTRTRSKAWQLVHGAWLVLVEGRTGGVALFALELAEDQLDLFVGKR